jgi:hypothetical protein
MINPTTRAMIRNAVHIPALKIPPITSQEERKNVSVNATRVRNAMLFLISDI